MVGNQKTNKLIEMDKFELKDFYHTNQAIEFDCTDKVIFGIDDSPKIDIPV